jgi:hypothetical protein
MSEHRSSPGPIAVALGRLFDFYGRELEPHVGLVYARALSDYAPGFVAAAVERAMETREFLPKPGQLRADAEACRREIVARSPFTPCPECERSPGWVSTVDDQGVTRVSGRCRCFREWQARLEPAIDLRSTDSPARPRFKVVGGGAKHHR